MRKGLKDYTKQQQQAVVNLASPLEGYYSSAMNYMISHPNPDGTLGYMVEGNQAREWFRFFKGMNLMTCANYLASQVKNGKQYMVPAEWPEQYDASFVASKDRFREVKALTLEEKQRVIRKFETLVSGISEVNAD